MFISPFPRQNDAFTLLVSLFRFWDAERFVRPYQTDVPVVLHGAVHATTTRHILLTATGSRIRFLIFPRSSTCSGLQRIA